MYPKSKHSPKTQSEKQVSSTSSDATLLVQQTQETLGPIHIKTSLLKRIFSLKKSNAKRAGVEFSIPFEEIRWPYTCPLLGIILNYGLGNKGRSLPESQSFDRKNPEHGYISGNVQIISHKANQIKSTASIDELMQLACNYKFNEERQNDNDSPD